MSNVTTTYTVSNLADLADHFDERARDCRASQKLRSRGSHEGIRYRGAAEAWEIAADIVRNTVIAKAEKEGA